MIVLTVASVAAFSQGEDHGPIFRLGEPVGDGVFSELASLHRESKHSFNNHAVDPAVDQVSQGFVSARDVQQGDTALDFFCCIEIASAKVVV